MLDRKIIDKIEEIVERIDKIDWFSNCGKQVSSEDFEISSVSSWSKGKSYYSTVKWENIQLEARNNLTEYLCFDHREVYRLWNKITDEAKKYIQGPFDKKLEEYRNSFGLDKGFVNTVKWDILAAIMEYVYLEYKIPVFYLNLLKIYEKGHFPCGWDGKWPEGKLRVY